MDRALVLGNFRNGVMALRQGSLGVPVLVLMLLAMMTLPMPSFLLDVFFTFNIALSIVVLLVSVYALRPLDFAVFPTILLVATLLRLALNIASTRVVLLHGQDGGDAAADLAVEDGDGLGAVPDAVANPGQHVRDWVVDRHLLLACDAGRGARRESSGSYVDGLTSWPSSCRGSCPQEQACAA